MKKGLLETIRYRTKTNPVFSKELEKEFHLPGSQNRDLIRELRRKGYPICSDEDGYFYSEDPNDIHATVMQLKSRLISLSETSKAMAHTEYQYRMKLLNQAEMFNDNN